MPASVRGRERERARVRAHSLARPRAQLAWDKVGVIQITSASARLTDALGDLSVVPAAALVCSAIDDILYS